MVNKHHDLGERIQALTLLTVGWTPAAVSDYTKISQSQIKKIRQKAIDRGFRPEVSTIILLDHVRDAPRSGRPRKTTLGKDEKVKEVFEGDRYPDHDLAPLQDELIPGLNQTNT